MLRNTILFLPLFFLVQGLQAQKYVTAAGMRLGTDWGVTVQQKIARRLSVEAIAQSSLQRDEIMLTGLLEHHMPFLGRRFNLYLGAGVHKGWLGEDRAEDTPTRYEDPFGITFVGGLEFTIGRLNLSYDLKPAINLQGGTRNFYTQSGLSLRFVIISEKDVKKRQRRKKREKRREARGSRNPWEQF